MLVSPDLMPIMESGAGELGLLAESLRARRWGVRHPGEDSTPLSLTAQDLEAQ